MEKNTWFQAIVLHGHGVGKTLGYPTLNLDAALIPASTTQGVYSSMVTIDDEKTPRAGALYYGPRLVFGEEKIILEIFVLDFDQDVYGQTISFTVEDFIREPRNLPSLEALQQQLTQDVEDVRKKLAAKHPNLFSSLPELTIAQN